MFVHQRYTFLLLVQLTPVHCISFLAKSHLVYGKIQAFRQARSQWQLIRGVKSLALNYWMHIEKNAIYLDYKDQDTF